MRLAILADIHGNSAALDTVMAHADDQGPDHWVFVGDYVGGEDPVGVLERITALPNATFVRGNTERFVLMRGSPFVTIEDAASNPSLVPELLSFVEKFAWQRGALAQAGWIGWIEALPVFSELSLPGHRRLLVVHASPFRDDGPGLKPTLSDAELTELFSSSDHEVCVSGHTHRAMARQIEDRLFVNPGSVGKPLEGSTRASYAIIEATEAGARARHFELDYDGGEASDRGRPQPGTKAELGWDAVRHYSATYRGALRRDRRAL